MQWYISTINELFHDILIYWDAPAYLYTVYTHTTSQEFLNSKILNVFFKDLARSKEIAKIFHNITAFAVFWIK